MTKQEQIQIAKDFISRHKNDDINSWQPLNKFGDDKYLDIYNNLTCGFYGEARCLDQEVDDDGNTIVFGIEFECEIGSFESASGNPVLFVWEDDEYSQVMYGTE